VKVFLASFFGTSSEVDVKRWMIGRALTFNTSDVRFDAPKKERAFPLRIRDNTYMTPANVRKFKEISNALKAAAERNVKAEDALFIVLDTIAKLTQIATDLHFRPEVNS
jgi:hypothetical protein